MAKRGKVGEMAMLNALNGSQAQFYLELAEKDSRQETFVYGWLTNRVVISGMGR